MRRKYWGLVQSEAFVAAVVFLFYRDLLWMALAGIPIGLAMYSWCRWQWKEEEKWQLNLEFKEGLQGIAAALNAGYSIENALEESRKDLVVLYGEESVLCREFQSMLGQLRLNQPVESVFDEFARRCDVEDIRRFAEILRTARRSGGDLVAITRTSAQRIGEKIAVEREIHAMLAGRQLEGKIMNIVPLGIILYFWICSPGYLDSLYGCLKGHLAMTLFLAVYLAAYVMNQRICRMRGGV